MVSWRGGENGKNMAERCAAHMEGRREKRERRVSFSEKERSKRSGEREEAKGGQRRGMLFCHHLVQRMGT